MRNIASGRFGRSGQLQNVMQSEAAECALACLCMVACYYGHNIDLASMRRRFGTSSNGIGLARVIEMASALMLQSRALRVELGGISNLRFPCILHWDMGHFVVASGITKKGLEISDPARGQLVVPLSEVNKSFTGVALELAPMPTFAPIEEVTEVSLRSLTGKVVGAKRILIQAIGLALAIELMALALPFQLQLTVDQVLLSHDLQLALVLVIAFAAVVIVRCVLLLARAWLLSWFGASLNTQWIVNVFSHLMSLPLQYFEKRHIGDTVSRFVSLHAIQRTITGSFVEGVLDGIMSVLTLGVMYLYSPSLALFVLLGTGAYCLLRFLVQRAIWRANEEQLIYAARLQTEMIESISGVQAIKLGCAQNQRRARLAGMSSEVAQRDMRTQRLTLAMGAANQSVFGLQKVGLIAIGGYLVLDEMFSTGMLIAFLVYADQFSTKAGGLIDKLADLLMLKLHLRRVADIALAEPEISSSTYSGPEVGAAIELENISFRYAAAEPWVVQNISLRIGEGESVCITGPSGCGKSTLVKIILGLIEPTEGRVLIDGIDIRKYGLDRYRKSIGAVMQDDQMFSGTVADNISFFEQGAPFEEIIAAAKAASIHDDIVALPMGYETLTGGMGKNLSGGQQQRVMLARALYGKPRILVLDEATSHLDVANEVVVNAAISELDTTRILVAHRQETVRTAQRVIELSRDGRIVC